MRILVLDDNEIIPEKPPSYFVHPHDYRDDYIEQYRHPDLFLAELYAQEWDEVWLDHDLGDHQYNGKKVTEYIQEQLKVYERVPQVTRIRITSMNPHAAGNMISDLADLPVDVLRSPIGSMPGVERGFSIPLLTKLVRDPTLVDPPSTA